MKVVLAVRAVAAVLSLTAVLLLFLSGWALMAGYVPSDSEAFASVLYWRQQGGWGVFSRGLHYHLSSALVITGFLYLATTYLAGRHRESPLAWWLGLACYLVVLGICFTGFLLPMDQNAWWGTIVRLGIVETAPLGTWAADFLRGGPVINAMTLPRFHALHVSILPLLALLLLAPLGKPLATAFKQGHRLFYVTTALAGVLMAYLVTALWPAPLELAADPTDTEYVPRPEWYFLWLFQFGKYVESVPWVRSFVLPLLGLGFLFALPRLGHKRPASRAAIAGGWCLAYLALTGLALWDDRGLPPKLDYEAAMRERAGEGYEEHCVQCHGVEGRGDGSETEAWDLPTPDLTREEPWQESSRADMIDAIKNGKGEDMPAFGKRLGPSEIEALVDFLEIRFRPAGSSAGSG